MTSLMAATALCGAASAQTLRIADVEALPGETVAFALTVDVEGGGYSGFQFQMKFPVEGFTTTGTTISPEWDGASFGVGDLDASGEANGSAFSTSDTAIPDGEREIGTVKFTVADDVTLGDYPVTISGFNFLDGSNYTPVDADVTFIIRVVNAHSVVLDENSLVAPTAAEGGNVLVKRTIKSGEWSTICLPFAMTATQLADAFGSGVQLAEFVDYDYDETLDAISVNFTDATMLEANHPYLIKVDNDVTQFSVSGVDIDPQEDDACIENDNGRTGSRRVVYSGFYGTYHAGTIVPELCLFLSDNHFWYSVGLTKMKGFRAYFEFLDVLSDVDQAYGSRIRLSFDDTTTGIKTQRSTPDYQLFDLQGHPVSHPACGLYIKNGRKEIVK